MAAIHGSGFSNQPLGILATSGIGNVVVGPAGGAPTSDLINALEAAVGGANADDPSCGFLTNSIMRSRLRKIPEMTGGVSPLWDDNSMLDYPALVSNQVSSSLVKGTSSDCSAILFGSWDQLIVAEFGGAIEVTYDPYTLKKQGQVELCSYAVFDVCLAQSAAMAAILDARNI